jgi:DNA polymerase-1
MQAPIIEMMLRGMRVDQEACSASALAIAAKVRHYEELLDYIGELSEMPQRKSKNKKKEIAGDYDARFLNARSGPMLKEFFYNICGAPVVRSFKAGVVSSAMDEEALGKIKNHLLAKPFAKLVLEIRRLQEGLKRLRGAISKDGRAHTSYGIAGTTTGRLASSGWIDGTSQNLQNVAAELRHIYIADPGWKLCSIDLEQAESRMVGWICGTLFDMWKYLDFAETKDVHTYLTRLTWPDLPWTGEDKYDKKIAQSWTMKGTELVLIDSMPDGTLSLRDKSKRNGHGSNYNGTPKTLADRTQLSLKEVTRAQNIYFQEFPEIRKWQQYVIARVSAELPIVTPLGWERKFLGYPKSSTTHREAIAFAPQSSVGHLTCIGLYRVWQHFGSRIRMLLQVHDNIVFMFREDDDEDEIVSTALSLFEVPLHIPGRTMIIPGESYTGYNWGYFDEKSGNNPRGLRKWKRKQLG